jgi:hypothetical protein
MNITKKTCSHRRIKYIHITDDEGETTYEDEYDESTFRDHDDLHYQCWLCGELFPYQKLEDAD